MTMSFIIIIMIEAFYDIGIKHSRYFKVIPKGFEPHHQNRNLTFYLRPALPFGRALNYGTSAAKVRKIGLAAYYVIRQIQKWSLLRFMTFKVYIQKPSPGR